MASIEYQNSILWKGEDPLKRKFDPLNDKSKKVERYRPGKAPIWVQEENKRKEKEAAEGKGKKAQAKDASSRRKKRDPTAAAVVLEDSSSSRLKRLREAAVTPASDPSDRLVRHRMLHEARVLEAVDEKVKDEEEEKIAVIKKEEDLEAEIRAPVAELTIPMYDDISGDEAEDNELRTLRRERAREAALEKRKKEEDVLKEEVGDEAEEEEDSEESEEDSDDDDPRRGARLKPVFVSKSHRETVKEKEAQEKEEDAAKAREEERQTERKAETKDLLHGQIRHDDEVEAAVDDENDKSDIELIDDDDEKDEAEEYDLWKIRELKRIKRDKEERLDRQKELELIERRRRMTDAEREEDDKRMDDKAAKRAEVGSFAFLQKYYHRGGFFQDKATNGEEPLYNRDYHEPTAEETFDKNMLPKAMQLRRGQFGKKGQVKHTHLTAVDTTDQTAAWAQHTKVMQKYQEKMSTAKSINVFDRAGISSSSRAPPP